MQEQAESTFDFVFLDADRGSSVGWWNDIRRILRPGGLLVADNAVSHVHEMSDLNRVKGYTGNITSLVPTGNGRFVVLKQGEL